MRIKDGFVKQQVGDVTIVVAIGELGKEFHSMIQLNHTAADIWDWLAQGISGEDVAKLLAEKYSIELSKAQKDAGKIIDKMISAGVVEDD